MKPLKGYICGTDILDIRLGANDVKIFSSIEALKESRKCWEECGILEIDIKANYVVEPLYEWGYDENN